MKHSVNCNARNNPAYINYLGELLIIDRILSASDKFRLEGIEVKLPNGKTADIQITDIVKGTKVGDEFQFAIAPIIWNELNDLVKWSEILTKIEATILMFSLCAYCMQQSLKMKTKYLTLQKIPKPFGI